MVLQGLETGSFLVIGFDLTRHVTPHMRFLQASTVEVAGSAAQKTGTVGSSHPLNRKIVNGVRSRLNLDRASRSMAEVAAENIVQDFQH